jgi:hypothetical protein
MRKVLAITVALMLAALVLSPAMGYTIQSAGNQAYTAQSGDRINYTIESGTAAHELTLNTIPVNSNTAPAVVTTRMPTSFKPGRVAPYSIKLDMGVQAEPEGIQIVPETARLGEGAAAEAAPVVEEPPVEAPPVTEPAVTEPAPVEEAPVEEAPVEAPAEEATFSIMGYVFDDMNGDGIMDENETGLAGWTVNLEQPVDTIIANLTTEEDGSYIFSGLSAGEYAVSEMLPVGWALIAPLDGKLVVNITDSDMTAQNFANQMITAPVAEEPVEEAVSDVVVQ